MTLFVYGPDVEFLAEPRQTGVLQMFDVNRMDDTVCLWISKTGINLPPFSTPDVTGYVFSTDDFIPSPKQADWSKYQGRILCFKSMDGKNEWMPKTMDEMRDEIRILGAHIDIRDTKIFTMLQHLEKKSELLPHDSYSIMEDARRLGEIKKLAEVPEIRMLRGSRMPGAASGQLLGFDSGGSKP